MKNPKLLAKFELNEKNEPIFIAEKKKEDERRHYSIQLFLEDVPPDTIAVVYRLHSTYSEPTRRVPVGVPKYREFITSYGDYPIAVTIIRKESTDNLSEMLSVALENNYKEGMAPDILEAIQRIRNE